jgi:hypothetical protein
LSKTVGDRVALSESQGAGETGPHSPARWIDIAALAILVSLLLTLWLITTTDKINPDGALYIDAAKRLLAGDPSAAYRLYPWPFFPACIAVSSYATGLQPESAALLLNAMLGALLSFSFVAVVQALGGDRRTLFFAAFVILTFPYLNEKRAEIIRDIGYWSFYLLGLLLFLRYFRVPSWQRALGWGSVALLATAFRIEGLAVLALLPSVLLWRRDSNLAQRLRATAMAYGAPAAAVAAILIALLASPELKHFSGRLFEPLTWLSQLWEALSHGLDERASLLRLHVFRPTLGAYALHAGDSAYPFLLAGIAGIIIFKLAATLTPLYSALLLVPRFRSHLSLDGAAKSTLAGLVAINLAILLVYVTQTYFLSSRFACALALTLLIPVPFALASVHDHWSRVRGSPLHRQWGYLLFAAALLTMALSGVITTSPSKSYVKEAGEWLRDNLPQDAALFTNVMLIDYYDGRGIAWDAREQYRLPPPAPLDSYDFAAVERRSGRFPASWEALAAEYLVRRVASFGNSRDDGITIFEILGQPP